MKVLVLGRNGKEVNFHYGIQRCTALDLSMLLVPGFYPWINGSCKCDGIGAG
jgi:hypothetical protein